MKSIFHNFLRGIFGKKKKKMADTSFKEYSYNAQNGVNGAVLDPKLTLLKFLLNEFISFFEIIPDYKH